MTIIKSILFLQENLGIMTWDIFKGRRIRLAGEHISKYPFCENR